MVYPFEGSIRTNYGGYNRLCEFYHFCHKLNEPTTFHVDFTDIEWIDGNLCALLLAMMYRLRKHNGHTFILDTPLKNNLFHRNGFLKDPAGNYDDRQSTVPIESFHPTDKEGFCKYVEKRLLAHRGIPPSLTESLKERMAEDLLEVLCNTNFHANTQEPFFVGGQYYPTRGEFKFTMVDLGDGFLPRIHKATNGRINDSLESILWTLDGNSTKKILEKCPGGLGIKNMRKYFAENKGGIQIISGNGYWSSDLETTIFQQGRRLNKPFTGTTINLIFKH